MKLYPHQQKLLNKNPTRHGLFFECGSGKTLTAIKLIEKNSDNCLVIVPKSILRQWEDEIKKWSVKKIDWLVITKETFRRDWDKLPKYNAIIYDECFVGNTLIETNKGFKKIKNIKKGDIIKNAIGYGNVLKKGKRNYFDDLVVINKKIKTTKNHLFLTNQGWKKASNLKINDLLLTQKYASDIMFLYTTNLVIKKYVKMFELWKNKSTRLSKKREKFLFWLLYNEICLEEKKNKNEISIKKCLSWEKGVRKKEKIIKKNVGKQSNEKQKNKGKSKQKIKRNRTSADYKRREREAYANTTKNIISRLRERMVWRISSFYEKYKKQKTKKNSKCLQNRYSKPATKNWYRSRWFFARQSEKKRDRQKKRKNFNFIRVENISFQKQNSNGRFKKGIKVYNLEISGHPSYSVNKILVHNCHYFAGYKSQMHKNAYNYCVNHQPKFIYGLTATPYLSSIFNLYALERLLGRKPKWQEYNRKYFYKVKIGRRMIPVQKQNLEKEVGIICNNIGTTVKMSDCVEVPSQIFQQEYFDLTAEQKKAIKEIKMTEVMPIVQWTKIHQVCGGSLKGDGYVKDRLFKCEKLQRVKDLCSQHPLIAIVCRYNAEIEMLSRELDTNYIINGKTQDRHSMVQEINTKKEAIVLINSVCSEGYELPKIPIMIFYSYDFSLKNYIQMRGRVSRMNKLKKNVYISLITKNTIDNDVYQNVVIKKQDYQIAIFNKEKYE